MSMRRRYELDLPVKGTFLYQIFKVCMVILCCAGILMLAISFLKEIGLG